MVDKIKFRIKIRIGNRGTGWISVAFLFKMEEMMKKIIDCLKENDNQIYNEKVRELKRKIGKKHV